MSGQLFTAANSKIYISETPVNSKGESTIADFASTVWIQIQGLYNLGELGGEQTINEFELIDEVWTRKTKGGRNGGTMPNQFVPMALDPGQLKYKEAIESCRPYQFKLERGADCFAEANVTIAIGGVVTWAGSNFYAGQPVILSGAGLPEEFTADTVYYVIASGLTANSFSLAATAGGAAITTTGASTGIVAASAPHPGMTDMFQGLATDGAKSGGAKNDLYTQTWPIAVDGRVVTV